MKKNQSAYQEYHSTETTLINVVWHLKMMDNQEVTCLVLLDLSAAFDMVDHGILLNMLNNRFGIQGTALKWIESYLTRRIQRVVIGDLGTDLSSCSELVTLTYDIPQGSVLGPIMFTLYMVPLGKICRNHDITYQLYADDQQMYISFKQNIKCAHEHNIQWLEDCIAEVRSWMCINLLMLNDNKTKFIVFGTAQQLNKINNITVKLAGWHGNTTGEFARNLLYFMDCFMKNAYHINKLCSQQYLMLWKIHHMRSYLNQDMVKIVVQALIMSKLDYCNSLLIRSAEFQ